MATDWKAMETAYVESGATYADLAERFGVSRDAVAYHGGKNRWVAKRRARLRGMAPPAVRAERPPAPAVDGARLRGKLLALADNWTDQQAGQIEDVGDYRRVVQSVLDLTRAEGDAAPEVRVVMDAPGEYSR